MTDYAASDAQQLLNFTNSISDRNGFISVVNAISPRLQTYDKSLTQIEDVASSANTLFLSASTYNAGQAESQKSQIQGFLQQVNYYLNQKVGDRFIFAGTRFTTEPVKDLTTLGTPTAADVAAIDGNVSGHLLPVYDVNYQAPASASFPNDALTVTAKNSGTFGNGISIQLGNGTTGGTVKATISVAGQADEVIDNIAISANAPWGDIATAITNGSRLVSASAGTVTSTPTLPSSVVTLAGGTGTSVNDAATLTVAGDITYTALHPGLAGNNITVTIGDDPGNADPIYKRVTVTDGATTEHYDTLDSTSPTFWADVRNAINGTTTPATTPSSLIMATTLGGTDAPTDGTVYLAGGVSTSKDSAYANDQVSVDTTQKLTYGINSNQKGFQQLILGLRYAYQAFNDTDNYAADIAQAKSLVTAGLDAIRGYHTSLSSNSATLDNIKTLHNDQIDNLKTQISNIQGVDVNAIAVKLNSFQATLQASYAATANLTSLSILKYL